MLNRQNLVLSEGKSKLVDHLPSSVDYYRLSLPLSSLACAEVDL